MPIFVKTHMRAGISVRGYRRNTSKIAKAGDLLTAFRHITGRGGFLSKPQKKAFEKAHKVAYARVYSKAAGAIMTKDQMIRKIIRGL